MPQNRGHVQFRHSAIQRATLDAGKEDHTVHYRKTTESILGKINLEYIQNGHIVLYYILYELQVPQTEHTKAKH